MEAKVLCSFPSQNNTLHYVNLYGTTLHWALKYNRQQTSTYNLVNRSSRLRCIVPLQHRSNIPKKLLAMLNITAADVSESLELGSPSLARRRQYNLIRGTNNSSGQAIGYVAEWNYCPPPSAKLERVKNSSSTTDESSSVGGRCSDNSTTESRAITTCGWSECMTARMASYYRWIEDIHSVAFHGGLIELSVDSDDRIVAEARTHSTDASVLAKKGVAQCHVMASYTTTIWIGHQRRLLLRWVSPLSCAVCL